MFTKLNEKQINEKITFINNYINAENAASGSEVDSNANVSYKNIATLNGELYKDFSIQIRRKIMHEKIEELFGVELADQYIKDLEDHYIYAHDETSGPQGVPYCASITLYPFLLNGLTELGGESKAPEHLESFCGGFVNLIFAVSAQIAGAVATPEVLTYFDYFARKDYGDDYLITNLEKINNHLQHLVYALNQPAAARSYQSVNYGKI